MRTAADKYLSQDSIQITNENYMEVMEAIYDYPDEFEARQSSLQALSITTPVMPIVNFCSDSALSTVSQILVSMDC